MTAIYLFITFIVLMLLTITIEIALKHENDEEFKTNLMESIQKDWDAHGGYINFSMYLFRRMRPYIIGMLILCLLAIIF